MEFRILGPLEVWSEGGAVALEGNKPRAVLAVLLLHSNQPVSAERLALALWGEAAPAGATRTVQVHVSRLRKALGDAEVVATTPAGYRLRVRRDELDADRFERGVEAGRRALSAGSPVQAAVLLREALGLWRGPPLADLEFEPFAQVEIARLEEQRLAALDMRVEADLAAGRHVALVGELQQLLVEHPTQERLAAHLMLALYRCGRQAEALEVYRRSRLVLVEQAGVEPGPELRRLHEAVLAQDPALDAPMPATELPRELDAGRSPPLVGRDAELARLREHWEAAQSGAGRIVTIEGADGMGKTRLAAELAGERHRAGDVVLYLAGRGPQGAALASLRELEQAVRPSLVVLDDVDRAGTAIVAALGVLARALGRVPVLLLLTARDADGLAGVGAEDVLALEPLDADAVRAAAAGDVPVDWLLDASGGVPRRVHQMIARWTREEAARRVDVAAGRTAAGRAELRSIEAELTGGVIELQAAQERAEPVDDEEPVRCPFKGLASFDVADAPYFFGRERLVAELVARLVGAPLLGIVGPSGSGKSSVMRAGLLPALAAGVLPGSGEWAQLVMRPGAHPVRALANVTADVERGRRVLLAVDQFEETFTACRDEQERAAFVAELVAGDHGDRVVVLAVRADHYGRCAAYPELASGLAAHHVLVGAMRRDELHRAVELPAARAGLQIDPELTDALVADVEHEPGPLPMLSTALLELWQHREGRRLRLPTYEASGGVRGAVARHAEEAFARLSPSRQAVAHSVLLRLASEGADGAVERRRVPLAELEGDEDVAGVVALLTDQRLLTVSAGAVEVAHEALLREWPRLRGWLEEDAEGRRVRRHLADAAREWDDGGRDSGDLYRGARLAGALEWRARHEADLNPSERALLDASSSAERSELQAARARRTRALTLGAALLIVITGISTVLAVRGIQRARYEERAADSRSLATRALTHVDDNLALAGLLGLEAYRREPTIEARSAVLSVLPALSDYHRLGGPLQQGVGLHGVAISPDGRTLASAGDTGSVSLWDISTHRRLELPATEESGSVNGLAFSPDGNRLVTASEDATVRLWDVATRRLLGPVLRHRNVDLATAVAFSPDGKRVATAGGGPVTSTATGEHATVQLWDATTRRALGPPLKNGTEAVSDVEFSPDGKLLATSAGDGSVRLWDAVSRRPAGPPLTGHLGPAFAVAFSPDGRTIASAGDDTTVRLWDVRALRPLGRLESRAVVNAVAFSPDGRTVAGGGWDATVRLWDVATRRLRVSLLADTDRRQDSAAKGRVAGILGLAFSPRGDILASAGEDRAVHLWDLSKGRPLSRALRGHEDWVRAVAFGSGGGLVSGSLDGSVRLWDTRRGRPLRGAPRHGSGVLSMGTSPDGRSLALGAENGTLTFWDARARRPLGRPLNAHAGAVKAVAFSPDGDTLASGGADATVRVWDTSSRKPRGPPIDARGGTVNGVAFDRDGETLATAGADGTVRLWDVGSHDAIGSPLQGSGGPVKAVAFSPEDDVLASAGVDKAVWLWDADTHRPLGPPLTGHTDVIESVAFSADGDTLATAGADHTVRLWDVPSRRPLGRPLQGHSGWVSAVAFDPRGNQLASAGEDGTVRLWDPILWSDDPHELQRRLCAVIRRNLTHAEWSEYVPDRAYHRTCPGAP